MCVNNEIDETKQLILAFPAVPRVSHFSINIHVFLSDHQYIVTAIIPHKEI